MKVVVSVIIYNRRKNLVRWLEAWKQSGIENAELRIIHNLHPEESTDNFRQLCHEAGVVYIPRHNTGMDIGAFQDVCRRRLPGFEYDFDYLLWITDDTFPMRRTFVEEFIAPFTNHSTGLTCYEISHQIRPHIRTTGFCLKAETMNRIIFEAEPVRTKTDCYQFEHMSHRNLHAQIQAMGLQVVQIAPVPSSPVWDSGGGGVKWPDREEEFLRYWKIDSPPAKVIIIAPAFNRYPVIVSSMISQTYTNWELHLVHDGPAPHNYPRFDDERVIFTEMPRRRKEFGHPIRMDWLDKVKSREVDGKYVVVSNDDNYHVPHFLEKLVRPLEANQEYVGSYCSMMVHNYQGGDGYDLLEPIKDGHINDGYGIIDTKPQVGYIDCAAVMIRSEIAGQAGWPSTRHSSDWDYLNNIAWRSGGWNRFKKEFGALVVHN